ncbi:hypothetical protein [Paraburkholderia caffeinilytica]|uniref:hypothetical protein n=1 Tax=Paraburkholderia caffeinilytica TaxID=1761016 RepID=UPI003DA0CCA0
MSDHALNTRGWLRLLPDAQEPVIPDQIGALHAVRSDHVSDINIAQDVGDLCRCIPLDISQYLYQVGQSQRIDAPEV